MHYSKTKNLVHPQVVVLNLLLVLSLLFTQWLGISHAIFMLTKVQSLALQMSNLLLTIHLITKSHRVFVPYLMLLL